MIFIQCSFDILIQQKVRQVGLSETGAAMYFERVNATTVALNNDFTITIYVGSTKN